MSTNFFLFLLDLNWIFLGNKSDKLKQERMWEMLCVHSPTWGGSGSLLLFLLADLMVDPLWMVASTFAPGRKESNSYQGMLLPRLDSAQYQKDNMLSCQSPLRFSFPRLARENTESDLPLMKASCFLLPLILSLPSSSINGQCGTFSIVHSTGGRC